MQSYPNPDGDAPSLGASPTVALTAIAILPADGGWLVRCNALDNALAFRSGASAERAALRLAQGFADAGTDTQISVFIRDGSLAKRFVTPASRPSGRSQFSSTPNARRSL